VNAIGGSAPSSHGKRGHGLHTCRTPDAFLARFEFELGTSLPSFVDHFIDRNRLAGVVLGGSIPLGLGTSSSDVDLIVMVDSGEPIEMPTVDPRHGVVFSGAFAGTARLDVGEVIVMRDGVEVDVHCVSGPRVVQTAAQVRDGSISLTEHEIGVLSRIKTGWVLDRSGAFDAYCGVLLDDNSLEVRAATWHLVGAFQELEDSQPALSDNIPLALHLGRKCVEKVFAAFFASRGFAFLGGKWMRAHNTDRSHALWPVDDDIRALTRDGLTLLFPNPADVEPAAYLDRVARFVDLVRTEIEKDMTFKVAFALSPQLRSARL